MTKHGSRVMHDDPGMAGQRSRNQDGQLRQKRNDTHIGTVEDERGVDLDYRRDAHLGAVLKKEGVESLDQLLRKKG